MTARPGPVVLPLAIAGAALALWRKRRNPMPENTTARRRPATQHPLHGPHTPQETR